MIKLTQNQQLILNLFLEKGVLSSSDVHGEFVKKESEISLVTIKRELSELKSLGFLETSGAGRSVTYAISAQGRMITSVDAKAYCAVDPDKRFGLKGYNFELLRNVPNEIFSETELGSMESATKIYREHSQTLSETLREKELERFIIELSWKSSKIEGNTYTLLDTEKLVQRGIEAVGHDKAEAAMILNHKEAFKYILANLAVFSKFTRVHLEEIHKILIKDLNIDHGLRSKAVGVTGSLYRPIDNIHQIQEAITTLAQTVDRLGSPYAKAMIALLGTSYIQPFEDGNKRTSRLMANAILLANQCAPLSYRSVDENEYREAVLVFYELNSIVPFKKIFVEQYLFAAQNYAVK